MLSTPAENSLQLVNTMTGTRQAFVPLAAGTVKMFTCGPSIYGAPHLGNYRTFLFEDILQRYLEYRGCRVDRLINFTDIEDKAIEKAGKNRQQLRDVTMEAAEQFYRNTGLLHISIPDFIPRSSTSVDQAVKLIKELVNKGFAYRLGSDFFYDPLKFEGFGRLYGLDMSRWPARKIRFRRDTYPGNRWNRGDFILWHGYNSRRDGDVYWDTELGRGRPSWNIQDPAIITKHLGFQIDIACGGVDNLFRHHDYNIAVIEAVSGREFSPFWLHGEHVLLEGKKMSKSKGNIVYPDDLLAKNMSAAGIRFLLISIHYRRKLNLTESLMQEKQEQCRALQALARQFTGTLSTVSANNPQAEKHIRGMVNDFESAMNNDLNVGPACDSLLHHLEKLALIRPGNGLGENQWSRIRESLLRIDSVLRILFE